MKEKNKKIRFWILYHAGLLLFSIGNGMHMKYKQTGSAFTPTTVSAIIITFVLSACIGYLAIYLANKGNKLPQHKFKKQIAPAFLIFLGGSFIIANLTVTIVTFIIYIIKGFDLNHFLHNLVTYEMPAINKGMASSIVVLSLVFLFYLWQKASKDGQKLIEENLKYKYQNLKAQVKPHFLFNSLNTLSELVYGDSKKADQYIQKLSSVYRYILENEDRDFVPLNDELKFIQQYFDLQKERDDNKIALNIDVENADDYKIIPVSLQILVENALKHNVTSKEKPLIINIVKDSDELIVSNRIEKKNILESSLQSGLTNLKERLTLMVKKELLIQEDNGHFTVHLPIIKNKT